MLSYLAFMSALAFHTLAHRIYTVMSVLLVLVSCYGYFFRLNRVVELIAYLVQKGQDLYMLLTRLDDVLRFLNV